MRKILEQVIKWSIALSFFIPLIILPDKFIFPFIVPKILIFRSVVLIMLGVYILLLLGDVKRYSIKKTPITLAVIFYLLSFLISTIVGVDSYKSLWDNHERMLGFFTICHYAIYYFVATSIFTKWSDWRYLLRIFLGAGSMVMIIGMIQKVSPEFLLNRGSDRVSATLGNAIYYGAYGAFLSLVGWLLYAKEKNNNWKYYSIICGLIGIIGLLISGTRGVLIGFVLGVVAMGWVYVKNINKNSIIRSIFIAGLIVGILGLGTSFYFRGSSFVQKIPTVGRLVNIKLDKNSNPRLMAWSIAMDAWKERPVFGWGPNNYYYAFNKYYNPQLLKFGYTETWFDNAHSATINAIAVQGTVGLFAYLALFVVPILFAWRAFVRKKIDVHIFAAAVGYFVFHYTQQLFVFENPTSYIYFFFFLALINSLINKKEETENTRFHADSLVQVLVVVCVGCIILITNVYPARANMATLDLIRSIYNNKDVVSAYEHATGIYTPHIDDMRIDFGRSMNNTFKNYVTHGHGEKAVKLARLAHSELNNNRRLHPGDIRIHLQQTQLSQMITGVTREPSMLLEAKKTMEEAIEYSPKRQQLYYTLAGVEMQLNNAEEAINTIEKSTELNPKISESWWRLVLIYKTMGQTGLAKEATMRAVDEGVKFNEEGKKIVGEYLPTEN